MSIRWTFFVGAGLLILGLFAVVVLRPDVSELDDRTMDPVVTSVVEHEESYVNSARLVVEVEAGTSLVSSGVTGRVTEVLVGSGDVVASGTMIARVDGVAVVAMHTRTPLWRTLKRSSRGDDVSQLQCALKDLGFYEGDCNGSFDAATTKAVQSFNEGLGRGKATEFDDRFVIWLPAEQLTVGATYIEPGAWFPSPGALIIESALMISEARVETEARAGRDRDRFSPLVFVPAGTQGEIQVDDDLSVAVEDLGPLAGDLIAGMQASAEFGGIPGELRGSRTHTALAVPTSAIIETADAFCVHVSDGSAFFAVEVTPSGSTVAGATFLEPGELTVGSSVVVNPYELSMMTC